MRTIGIIMAMLVAAGCATTPEARARQFPEDSNLQVRIIADLVAYPALSEDEKRERARRMVFDVAEQYNVDPATAAHIIMREHDRVEEGFARLRAERAGHASTPKVSERAPLTEYEIKTAHLTERDRQVVQALVVAYFQTFDSEVPRERRELMFNALVRTVGSQYGLDDDTAAALLLEEAWALELRILELGILQLGK